MKKPARIYCVEVHYEPFNALETPRYTLSIWRSQDKARSEARNFNRRMGRKRKLGSEDRRRAAVRRELLY